jgi:hypothetical protein
MVCNIYDLPFSSKSKLFVKLIRSNYTYGLLYSTGIEWGTRYTLDSSPCPNALTMKSVTSTSPTVEK